jgi:ACS family allantoate permease-like MFS transporter
VLGYLAWEYPTNRLLQRLPLGKYSAACILMWGLILSCFAAVKSYSGAIAIRFFLGVFEAAVTPGFALLTSQVCTNPKTRPQSLTMSTVVYEERTG